VVAATRSSVLVSNDKGATWQTCRSAVVCGQHPQRGHCFRWPDHDRRPRRRVPQRDGGATWEHVVNGLPGKDITSVSFDSTHHRLLATSDATGVIFESRDGGRSWQRGPDSGFPAAPGQRDWRTLRGRDSL
jgi:hypothetical protein